MVAVRVTGLEQALAVWSRKQAATSAASKRIVALGGLIIENEAKHRRPIKTGALRRSIKVFEVAPAGTGWRSQTGPTIIYGRRIELGFTGPDSLGRRFNQAPRPFLAPGFEAAKPKLGRLALVEWSRALGS